MEFAEHLKAQVDIVRTVGEYVRLRRAGTRWVGLCPFHTEKTPSFGVTPTLGIYKCFGCGAGGDVIKFVQEIEQLTFWEALKTLAERNGIPLPQRQAPDADTQLRAAVFEMYEIAAKFYTENLFGAPGAEAREYLIARGLSGSTAQEFRLGYAEPGWDNLLKRMNNRFSVSQLEASGLFGRREDGGFYDKFRGRLMFPIHNESGKPIAFGGRALKAGDEPKYLNSPETAIYRKSNVLFNMHRAKEAIRSEGQAVLVEGYMDVIGVFTAGAKNVVASCGTALTPAQVRALKRHSEYIVVNFDPDTAGANATERSLQMLLDEGLHVRILELEGGLDPDEFVQKRGANEYKKRLSAATRYFIWLADRARKKYGSASAEARMKGYEELLLPAIRRISDQLERAAVATEVADYLGLERNLVLAEFRRIPNAAKRARTPEPPDTVPARERVLLRSLVLSRECRELLLPVLRSSVAAKELRVWPVVSLVADLCSTSVDLSWEVLESSADETQQTLLHRIVLADKNGEVLTAGQAQAFGNLLAQEEARLQYKEVQKALQEAERSGDMARALELMSAAEELRRRAGASR